MTDTTTTIEETNSTPTTDETTRRGFLRGATGAAAAGATIAAGHHAGLEAADEADAIAATTVGLALAGAAVATTAGAVIESQYHVIGGNAGDMTGSEESRDLHRELYQRAESMQAADDSFLTTLENRIDQDSRTVAWTKAKAEAVRAHTGGRSKSQAKTDTKQAVDDYYTTVEKNHLNRWTEIFNNLVSIRDYANSDSSIDPVSMYVYLDNGNTSKTSRFSTSKWKSAEKTVKLSDGTTYTYDVLKVRSSNYSFSATTQNDTAFYQGPLGPRNNDSFPIKKAQTRVAPVDTGSEVKAAESERWGSIWDKARAARDQMRTNVNTYVEDLYQQYKPGEVAPRQILDPTTLAQEFASDYSSTGYYAYAGSEAAIAGYDSAADKAMTVRLEDSGITVKATLYTNWRPEGGSGLQVGKTYDPTVTGKPVWLSYEYAGDKVIRAKDWDYSASSYALDQVYGDNPSGVSSSHYKPELLLNQSGDTGGSTTTPNGTETTAPTDGVQTGFVKLKQPFTITEATNLDSGKSTDTVKFTKTTAATSQVSLTKEELNRLLELRQNLRDRDQPSGTGPIVPSVGSGKIGSLVLLVGGGLAGLALLNND